MPYFGSSISDGLWFADRHWQRQRASKVIAEAVPYAALHTQHQVCDVHTQTIGQMKKQRNRLESKIHQKAEKGTDTSFFFVFFCCLFICC